MKLTADNGSILNPPNPFRPLPNPNAPVPLTHRPPGPAPKR